MNNLRHSQAMNDMLLEEDEQYLKDLEIRISRTTMCIRCGLPIEGATVNQLRHPKCANAHTKEQVKLKRSLDIC